MFDAVFLQFHLRRIVCSRHAFDMRKTRLKILPARCLAMIGFLLLYLACPILAELSRAQPDRGLASFFQLQKLEHCARYVLN